MKKISSILIFICICFTTLAQQSFFSFTPGWVNVKIVETENSYISIGLNLAYQHQFAEINNFGSTTNEWDYSIDTALTFEFNYVNDFSSFNSSNYATGVLRGESSNRFYGTLIRFNSDFSDTIFTKTYNFLPGNGTMILSHLPVSNNKIILGGYLQDTDFTIYSALIETDTLGNIHWRQNYFCNSNNCELKPYHILKASDGGYFFTCKEIEQIGAPFYNEKTVIIKTDSLGNEEFRLHPGNPDLFTVAGWVLPTDDGNYITAYSDPDTITDYLPQHNPNSTIWIEKFNLGGNQLYKTSLIDYLPLTDFGNRYPYTIRQMINTSDGNIIIVGEAVIPGFILKITPEGEPLWFRFITPPQAEGNDASFESTKILGITPTTDGGYIMAGEYISTAGNIFPEDIQTAIAVKVDEFGCLEPGCQIGDGVAELTKANLGLQLYPNPTNSKVNVTIISNVRAKWVRVYGVTGRMVLQEPMSENSLQLDVSELVKGMYLLEVETEGGFREVKRLIVE